MYDIDPAPTPARGVEAPAGCGPLLAGQGRTARPPRQQIFEHVRAQGRAARADVARALGISAASVTTLTADLIALGFLREVDGSLGREPGREPGRGRPPVALEVVPDARHVVGVKLSDERHTAVLADFSGAILAEATLPTPGLARPVAQLLDEAAALVEELKAKAGRTVAAVGVGLSGLVDHRSGHVAWSPLIAERGLDAKAAFERRLGCPVHVDNDANLLTLAEQWFGAGRALADFAVVTIENGVGMGLVLDGRLFRGGRGLGLELGHTKVEVDGALCRCGQRGCLEAYLADYALAREAATALGRHPRHAQSAQGLLETLFGEAKAGNEAARTIFARAGRYLALGLANVVQLFDPALVILSGERMRYDYLYADEVLAEMRASTLAGAFAGDAGPVQVEIHAWGDLVWAQGAVALALAAVTNEALAA